MKLSKLGKICDILNGYAFKSSKYTNKGYRVIRITNVQKGVIVDEAPQYYSDKDMEDLKKYELFENDILMSLTGNVGRVGIMDKSLLPAALNQRVACLRLKSKDIYYKYLFYYLNSDRFENLCIENSNGIAQKNLSTVFLKDVLIPIPSLETQKEIVEILDKAQGLIDARKEQIRLMDELIQSVFYEMFGDPVENSMKWPLHFLSELCKVGSSKRIYKNEQTISGIPFLRISDLMNRIEVGAETCDLFISSEKFEELKEKGLVPKVGEILVTSRGTLGECYIVNDDDNFYFQDGMISWLSNISDLVLPKYLLYLFKTQGIKRQIDGFQAGSTVAYLSITMLKQLEIVLPPIELQNQFISFIQQVDRLKIHAQKSLDEMLGLFDSLIQRYFE